MEPLFSEPVLNNGIPHLTQMLIWDVFFASRGRGISFSAHFPWAESNPNIISLAINPISQKNDKRTIAALIIKPQQINNGDLIGLVGLVCVAEAFRGQGLCARLLSKAIETGARNSFKALVLWSQKPSVYAGHGFSIDEQEFHGQVETGSKPDFALDFSTAPWPTTYCNKMGRGLPAFALGGKLFISDHAKAIVLETKTGFSVAEWQGDPSSVTDLLEHALPKQWSLSINPNDPLLAELRARNFLCSLKPGAVRMIKTISSIESAAIPKIGMLDRI